MQCETDYAAHGGAHMAAAEKVMAGGDIDGRRDAHRIHSLQTGHQWDTSGPRRDTRDQGEHPVSEQPTRRLQGRKSCFIGARWKQPLQLS
eukprot:1927216-Prymnesium_polylepis.1